MFVDTHKYRLHVITMAPSSNRGEFSNGNVIILVGSRNTKLSDEGLAHENAWIRNYELISSLLPGLT